MIVAVIADDLSGAAELAAAAANFGHSAEVQTCFDPASAADVIAVDADTRCLSPECGAKIVAELAREVLRAKPKWIYKKTDSVLRGNVRPEIEAVLETLGLPRALLIPANPSKGRLIRGGVYYIDGVPLAETAFANDPDHPRRSSKVVELLGETRRGAAERILVPDVTDPIDVRRHTTTADDRTLPAGGVEFFQALLDKRIGIGESRITAPAREPVELLVCGSAQAWQQGRGVLCDQHEVPVLAMPDACRTANAAAIAEWADQIIRAIAAKGRAMAAIGCGERLSNASALADLLAQAVATILRTRALGAICVEGGATAAAVVRAMGWTRLTAIPAGDLPGVAALRPVGDDGPVLYVKPGSYPWPQRLWPMTMREGV